MKATRFCDNNLDYVELDNEEETKKMINPSMSGLYISEPHGELLFQDKQKAIIKTRLFKRLEEKNILVSKDKAYGVIQFNPPEKIDVDEFRKRYDEHKVSDEERTDWWGEKDYFFLYTIKEFEKFEKPQLIKSVSGAQVFVEGIEFIKENNMSYLNKALTDSDKTSFKSDIKDDPMGDVVNAHRRIHEWAASGATPEGTSKADIVWIHNALVDELRRRFKEDKPDEPYEHDSPLSTNDVNDSPAEKNNAEFKKCKALSDLLESLRGRVGKSEISKPSPDVTENSIRLRQREPNDFQEDSFRTIEITDGIKAVIGKLTGETSTTIQSYIFDKEKFTTEEAQKWVVDHKKEKAEKDWNIPIYKSDEERFVYGIVLQPDIEDLQGDVISQEEIAKAAHSFVENVQTFGIQHNTISKKIKLWESYLAPQDLTIAGQEVKKGSWVMGVHVNDDEIWKSVKDGTLTGFSIRGKGNRE